jgi:glycerate kinase
VSALACPASLKGVLRATDAAAALVAGLGGGAVAFPVADGGEGTADVLARALGGEWRTVVVQDALGRPVSARWLELPDGTAAVESAEAIGLGRLDHDELDPLAASSAGLGELLIAALAAGPSSVLVCLGGSATVDGGAGLLAVLPEWPGSVRLQVACDVRNPLLGERGAARVYGPQKGASPEAVVELERRLAAMAALERYRDLPGAGAAGGLGAALASLGGELAAGAELVLDCIGFDERARDARLVVTGEGTVDRTTFEGKAPGAVVARSARLGVRCVLFGGRVEDGIHARELSGDPARARDDLVALGAELAAELPTER